MIVAWHEVPGTAPPQKSRPVGYGLIRAGVRTDSMISVTTFRARRVFRLERIRQLILFFQKRKSEVARYFFHQNQVNPEHAVRFKQTSDFKVAGINDGKSQLVHQQDN